MWPASIRYLDQFIKQDGQWLLPSGGWWSTGSIRDRLKPDTRNVTRTLARATGYHGLPAKWWASTRNPYRSLATRPQPDQGRVGLLRVVSVGRL